MNNAVQIGNVSFNSDKTLTVEYAIPSLNINGKTNMSNSEYVESISTNGFNGPAIFVLQKVTKQLEALGGANNGQSTAE